MRSFLRIWVGQFFSTIGSYMTVFALMIWVWQTTESATTLALISFFSQIPRLIVTPFAGIIVDQFSRKKLILLSDCIAMLCTVIVAGLVMINALEIWHLYIIVVIYGGFGQLQTLAYSTSIALLVEKENYTRAESMVSAVNYSSAIFSPILAGSLYPYLGLRGIIGIDLFTFLIAFGTLLMTPILQSVGKSTLSLTSLEDLTFGFRYIAKHPSLVAMVIAFTLFAFPSDIGKALYSPMILAKSGGNSQILGIVTTSAGVGGVLGALLLSAWGGFKKRVHGMLFGFIATGIFKILLGLGQTLWTWGSAHFLATLFIPMYYSSSNAIWYAKIPTQMQGRVLAADQMIGLMISTMAPLIAGPLADQVMEPAMQPGGTLEPILGGLFGNSAGSGMALVYTVCALLMVITGIAGFWMPSLRDIDTLLPDQASETT